MKFSSSRFDFYWGAPSENIKTYTKDGRFVREDRAIRSLRMNEDGTIASEQIPFTIDALEQTAIGIEELIEFPVVDDRGTVLIPPATWLPVDEVEDGDDSA